MTRRLLCALLAAVACAAAPPAAGADSLVFDRGGDVWIARPDGTGARPVTHDGSQAWAWPSEGDGGTIVAAGPSTYANWGSVNADLYVMDQFGRVSNRILTEADFSTLACLTLDPTHTRISPDGTRIAYDINTCGENPTDFWLPVTAQDFRAHDAQGLGQQGYGEPAWLGDDGLLLNYGGVTLLPDQRQTFVSYALGGQNTVAPWFDDDASGDDAFWGEAVSRAGDEIAVVESDLETDGSASHVLLRIFSSGGTSAPPTLRCTLDLPPDGPLLDGWTGYYGESSPTFSPDGRQIAFSEPDGIHVAGSDCSGVHLAIANAAEPYWSAADVQAPPPSGGGGGAPAPGGGAGTPAPGSPPPAAGPSPAGGAGHPVAAPRLRLRLARVRRQRLRRLLRDGLVTRVACSQACRLTLRLTLDARTARRAHLITARHRRARVTVGRARRTLHGGGSACIRVRLTRAARRRLRRLHRFTLRLSVTAAGVHASRSVRVRR